MCLIGEENMPARLNRPGQADHMTWEAMVEAGLY